MGRKPCCSAEDLKRGTWTAEEDRILKTYIKTHGGGRWRSLPKKAGLKRCGKSCRLRWLNYLRPDIKRGNITHEEEDLIIRLHKLVGNRWSLIAGRLPGRTDNEIKNYWNTHLRKKLQSQEQQEGCNPETTTTMMFSNLQHIIRENREGNLVSDQLVIGALTTDEPPELVSIESFTPQEENWWDVLLSLDAGDASAVVRSPQFNIVSLCGDESSPCKNNATDDDHNNHIFENWMSDPTQYNFDLELESVANFLNCH